MGGNYYRQMVLGIKPDSHAAVNNLAAKTTNGLNYGYSHHPGVGKQIFITRELGASRRCISGLNVGTQPSESAAQGELNLLPVWK